MHVGLTSLHEVAVDAGRPVAQRLVHDDVIQSEVARRQCVTWPGSDAVVEEVGLVDAVIDKKTKNVRRQVQRQDDEIDPVIAVEQVDAKSCHVHLLTLRPEHTYHTHTPFRPTVYFSILHI